MGEELKWSVALIIFMAANSNCSRTAVACGQQLRAASNCARAAIARQQLIAARNCLPPAIAHGQQLRAGSNCSASNCAPTRLCQCNVKKSTILLPQIFLIKSKCNLLISRIFLLQFAMHTYVSMISEEFKKYYKSIIFLHIR